MFAEIAEVCFRNKKWLASATLFLGAALCAYFYFTPAKYEARVRFLVRNGRAPNIVSAEETSGMVASLEVTDSQMATEVQLLSSRDVLRAASQPLTDRQASDPDAELELAANTLEKKLRITPILRSNLIEVRYADTKPERAVEVLQKLSDAYIDAQIKLRSNIDPKQFFADQAEQYRQQLEQAEQELTAFQRTTDIVALREQESVTLRKLADAESALHEVEASQSDLERRAAVLRSQLSTTPARIRTAQRTLPNQYSVERLDTLLVELQNKRTELLTKYRSDDRLVAQVDKQIADTKSALEKAVGFASNEETSDVNPVRQQVELELARTEQSVKGAKGRAEILASQIGGYQSVLHKLANGTSKDADLARRIKEAEENYSLYAKKREQSRIDEQLDRERVVNVTMAEAPVLPKQAQSKASAQVLAGYALANLFAFGAILVAGFFTRTFHTAAELERFTGVSVVGTISADGVFHSKRQRADTSYSTVRLPEQRRFLQPIIECMRSRAHEKGRGATFLMVPVSNHREPDSVAFQAAKDLCASTSSPVLVVPAQVAQMPEIWQGGLRSFPALEIGSGVAVALPPAQAEEVPEEVLDSVSITVPKEDYSYVIGELPPLSARNVSPLPLGGTQGVFLVVQAGKSLRRDVQQAMRHLQWSRCSLLGFILTNRRYAIPEALYRYL